MMVHHVATIVLMYFSWVLNFVRVGSLVLVVHDAADSWLSVRGYFIKEIDTFSGEVTLSDLYCRLSENGSILKGRNFHYWEQIRPVRIYPFTKGNWYPELQTESHKSRMLHKNVENIPGVSIALNQIRVYRFEYAMALTSICRSFLNLETL